MTLHINGRTLGVTSLVTLALLAAYLVGSARPSVAGAAVPAAAVLSTNGSASPADSGITVTGTRKVTGTPDTLRISMSVTVTRPDVDSALASANASAKAVQDALLAQGVAAKDLQTSNLSIQPNYTPKGQPSGYVVSEGITASVRDLAKAGATLTAAVNAGGDAVRVDGVAMALEDTSHLVGDARKGAVDDARAKAEQYAQAAGRSLGEVQSISEIVTQPVPQYYDSRFAAATAQASSPVPLQAGSQELTVQVTVVFALA